MFIAVIEDIIYISDIPRELTQNAIDAGEIRKGSVLGVMISPLENPENKTLIELKMAKNGQEKMVRRGARIPLEYAGSHYFISDDALEYMIQTRGREDNSSRAEHVEDTSRRPTPRASESI